MTDARSEVRARYAAAAGTSVDPMIEGGGAPGAEHYDEHELAVLPDGAATASLGCANPVALAELRAGEVVLDLGSGGGLDVLLSARRVGPSGRAYGLDMTDEMLEVARANQRRAGIDNAEFLKGYIEDVPLPDASVDVVLSNCVVNLSSDKRAVFAEAARVLRPGGRLALADVVAEDGLDPDAARRAAERSPCLAGALTVSEYRAYLADAGFSDVTIDVTRTVDDGFSSALVRALKPAGAPPGG
ncbi:MAG TPA: methyltransferase domain-containing protein [Actinomycetota bacterium]|nr:methyltransferase domain-containing protein [Actinomycetota bacterium]